MSNIFKTKIQPNIIGILALIAIGVTARLMPHWPNVVPITALAIWGGTRLQKPWGIVIPLVVMAISDIWLGGHSTVLYVYGSFLIIAVLSQLNSNKINFGRVGSLAVGGSLLFFLITNFGVWATPTGPMAIYPHTLNGLIASYTMGIPFWRNSLIGDIGYTAAFFAADWAVCTFASRHLIKSNESTTI